MRFESSARNRPCVAGCIDSALDAFVERHGLHSMLPLWAGETIARLVTLKRIPLHYWKRFYKLDSHVLLDVWKDIHAEVRRLKGLRCMQIDLHQGSIVC